MSDYREFIERKRFHIEPVGFSVDSLNSHLKPFQADATRWAIRVGRCDLSEDVGLGKTIQQLCYADEIIRRGGALRGLILCPLAVAQQTKRESEKFEIQTNVKVCREQSEVESGITITNYERLHKFDCSKFDLLVADEISCIKGIDSKLKDQMFSEFRNTKYKLGCSATLAPNDYTEMGNQAEFLGVMTGNEMKSMFFTHDGGETSKWRLRGHAQEEFWKWLGTFVMMIRKPSDIGHSDEGYELPPLNIIDAVVENDLKETGFLFAREASTLAERRIARRSSIGKRVEFAASQANETSEPWILWCDLNAESQALAKAVNGAVEVTGSDPLEKKEESLLAFSSGQIRALVSKPSICGFGLNWQHCHEMSFVGLSDSFEQVYQAIGRCRRFGQKHTVNARFIVSELEGAVTSNIRRKWNDSDRMYAEAVKHMAAFNMENVRGSGRIQTSYNPNKRMRLPAFV